MTKGSTIHASNLELALRMAIEALRVQEEKQNGPNFKSAFRQGLEDNLHCFSVDGIELRVIYN